MSALTALKSWPAWAKVLLFVVLSRLLLNVPAYIGANSFTALHEGAIAVSVVGADARSFTGMWARWDSGFYLTIAKNGYSFEGKEVAFFPAYPLLITILSAGVPALMTSAGYLLSNSAFVIASILLWKQVRLDFSEGVAWATTITLNLFPTSFFFSALYAESLLLLCSVLAYWFTRRQQYGLAGLCAGLAALTRINGFVLVVIPLAGILMVRARRALWHGVLMCLASGTGLLGFMMYMWVTQGSPLVFMDAHRVYWLRSIVWPWQTVIDGALVALVGYGGNEGNWFMRAISAQDLAAALLIIFCSVLSFFKVRRELFAYQASATLLLLMSHGPYAYGLWSAARWVITLFPCFIVMGLLLDRWGRFKWVAWSVSACALFGLTIWFANGRWVA